MLPSVHRAATVVESGRNWSWVAPLMATRSGSSTACRKAPEICTQVKESVVDLAVFCAPAV
jgi:hypothetical protein